MGNTLVYGVGINDLKYKENTKSQKEEVMTAVSPKIEVKDEELIPDKVKYVKPMTEGQEDYIACMAEEPITLCYGVAGTGKTTVAVMLACQYLCEKKIEKILITRPIVATSVKVLGAMPGDLGQKFDPYLMPIYEQLNKYFGPMKAKKLLDEKVIEACPLELLRGRTFDKTFITVDEAQNCTFEQLQMVLTRIGKDSKLVINGDFEQSDLKYEQGAFEDCVDLLEDVPGVGVIELTEDDIVRSPLIKGILKALRGREKLLKEREEEKRYQKLS